MNTQYAPMLINLAFSYPASLISVYLACVNVNTACSCNFQSWCTPLPFMSANWVESIVAVTVMCIAVSSIGHLEKCYRLATANIDFVPESAITAFASHTNHGNFIFCSHHIHADILVVCTLCPSHYVDHANYTLSKYHVFSRFICSSLWF